MKQVPQIIIADQILDDWPLSNNFLGKNFTCSNRWVLARPKSCGSIFTRFYIAFKVFTGELDAIKWDGQ